MSIEGGGGEFSNNAMDIINSLAIFSFQTFLYGGGFSPTRMTKNCVDAELTLNIMVCQHHQLLYIISYS